MHKNTDSVTQLSPLLVAYWPITCCGMAQPPSELFLVGFLSMDHLSPSQAPYPKGKGNIVTEEQKTKKKSKQMILVPRKAWNLMCVCAMTAMTCRLGCAVANPMSPAISSRLIVLLAHNRKKSSKLQPFAQIGCRRHHPCPKNGPGSPGKPLRSSDNFYTILTIFSLPGGLSRPLVSYFYSEYTKMV